MNDRDEQTLLQRIRECAYRLWEEAGRPVGREHEHWDKATELIAIEESPPPEQKPVEPGPEGEPVEPVAALENQGEFPTITDQSEQEIPARRSAPRR
jgi:hypothetical protein